MADLVFSQTFEAFARAMGDRLNATVKADPLKLGVNYDAPLLPAYPLDTWAQTLAVGASALFPGQPFEAQAFAFGNRFMDAYTETLVGKALGALFRVIGPRRLLERMTRNLRSANNYTETELTALPGGAFRLTFNKVLVPAFYRGLVHRGLEMAGAQSVEVAFEGRAGQAAAFVVRWQ